MSRYPLSNYIVVYHWETDGRLPAMAPSWNNLDRDRLTTPVDDSIVIEVIRAVAVCANRKPENLPPLDDTVDPDALEAIFGPRPDGTPRRGGQLEFSYAGCRVSVMADQAVEVEPINEDNG